MRNTKFEMCAQNEGENLSKSGKWNSSDVTEPENYAIINFSSGAESWRIERGRESEREREREGERAASRKFSFECIVCASPSQSLLKPWSAASAIMIVLRHSPGNSLPFFSFHFFFYPIFWAHLAGHLSILYFCFFFFFVVLSLAGLN